MVVPKTGYHCPGAPARWTLQIYQTGVALVWLHHVIAQLGTTDEGQPRLRYGQNERGEVAVHDTSKYTLHLDGYHESTLNVYEFCGILWHGRC